MDIQGGMARNPGPGLYEFLMEAELQQYYPGIRGDLKVQSTAQLKYVTEDDLNAIGMSKPEMRRLKKYFQKHFPQNYLSKFKKMLLPKREGQIPGSLGMLPEEKQDRPPVRVPNKHMIPADSIIVNKELGTGEFGVVQQGVWTNDGERIQVAIKCLSRERMQNNPIEFLKEAAMMHSIDHEHIVRLYGVVLDTNSLMLVTELAPLRSLLECLKEPSLRASFPVLSLCDFSVQISDGMQYLEAKRLIHRDLAARNILVFSKNKVKISDFGLSRALGVGKDYYQTNFNVNLKLPIAWCAPESISYLKFTSASDVWAYGVTLWEMFSYGFQPWPALTGHQILEAIDDPNFQRLEQPDCCPKEYYSLMLQCWQHEPSKRPKFTELINLLPDLKPEQVQAVQDNSENGQLTYRQGDVITVLDKGSSNTLWKGALNNGKTGFFNPAHTIAYLGSNLPSNKPAEFTRGDGKNVFSSQRRKIRTDMISSPQGDLKHTGHVGLDGIYFGDISFLGKYPNLPRQVVTPYKPQEDATDNSSQLLSQEGRMDSNRESARDSRTQHPHQDNQSKHESLWSDASSEISHLGMMGNASKQTTMASSVAGSTDTVGADHEYHEISDEENQDSPLRFDKPLSFDFGPSLLDEMDQMFRSLGSSPPPPLPGHPPTEHESSNARNELREIQAKQNSKKKQATVSPINVKPISAADQKTLYSAIAMAQELTARSMTDLEQPQESPRTPASPSRRRKFSFKLPHQHSPKPDRRHFSEEAARLPDCQAALSDEAKEAYNSLVGTTVMESTTDTNPLRMLRSGLPIVRPRIRGNKHATLGHSGISGFHPDDMGSDPTLQFDMHSSGSKTLPKRVPPPSQAPPPVPLTRNLERHHSMEIENNQNQNNVDGNPIPLPPRDRSKTLQPKSSLPRHQRKHPLIIPGGGVTRTLAKMTETTPPLEDQVDGHPPFLIQEGSSSVEGSGFSEDGYMPDLAPSSPEEFERRIDSELAALDSLPIDDARINRCSVISEDLLEFSDNLIDDSDPEESQQGTSINETRQSPIVDFHRKISVDSKTSASKFASESIGTSDFSRNSTPTEFDESTGCMKAETSNISSSNRSLASLIKCNVPGTRESLTSTVSFFNANPTPKVQSQSQAKESFSTSSSEDFQTKSGKYQRIKERTVARNSDLSRQSDHVSCEDLLDFAYDRPNTLRTSGPQNGEQSDEVRVMLKMLRQSTPESCVAALNVTNWNIHAAIKLERLQGLLKKENNFVGLEDCKVMLNQCDGDIVKAATLLRNTEDTAAV
ncbi:activated Cdc42 kinase-like isoform X2 [Belonocnema kinseyi]|uniref:activated Cdc42 kinase-like isoform X2 n=1 Tax=Belonocnema kinseyi TaxID=2817044 RepID=UPI00143D20B1|nr:activated Cdc42 kinase-like isoform X2 [Belonocnema kinseyi]